MRTSIGCAGGNSRHENHVASRVGLRVRTRQTAAAPGSGPGTPPPIRPWRPDHPMAQPMVGCRANDPRRRARRQHARWRARVPREPSTDRDRRLATAASAANSIRTRNALRAPPVHQGWLHRYDDADASGPLTYLGYAGYEQSGRLFSPAVTVTDMPGATPRSTQSNSSARRSQVLGTGATGSVLPSPLVRVVRPGQAVAGLRHDEEAGEAIDLRTRPSCR